MTTLLTQIFGAIPPFTTLPGNYYCQALVNKLLFLQSYSLTF